VGRYAIHGEIAAGGTATVHIGRLLGSAGFARTVAIKRLHASFARDPEFAKMFLDEARLAARVRHPHVVPVLDVVSHDGELLLVLEYVHGESLARLMKAAGDKPLQPAVAVAVMAGCLYGLHAAHEAHDERGRPLEVVHRDVSPQNVIVGLDGISRITDFGVAKAEQRLTTTREGQLEGKLAYLAPEQLEQQAVDRRADVYSAAVVLWEALTGTRLFAGEGAGTIAEAVLTSRVPPPSEINPKVPRVLDELVLRGLSRDPVDRFGSAREMALALERAVVPAPAALITEWVERVARDTLEVRARAVVEMEASYPHAAGDLPTMPPAALGRTERPRPQTVRPSASASNTPVTDFQSTLPRPASSAPRRRWVIGAGACLLAAALGVGLWFQWERRSGPPASAASTTAEPPAPTAASVASPPSPQPSAVPEVAPPPSASASTPPSAKASVPAKAPSPGKPAAKAGGKDPGFGGLTRF
jgi:eukaryotic-like serine/threonine-protein kinase